MWLEGLGYGLNPGNGALGPALRRPISRVLVPGSGSDSFLSGVSFYLLGLGDSSPLANFSLVLEAVGSLG